MIQFKVLPLTHTCTRVKFNYDLRAKIFASQLTNFALEVQFCTRCTKILSNGVRHFGFLRLICLRRVFCMDNCLANRSIKSKSKAVKIIFQFYFDY